MVRLAWPEVARLRGRVCNAIVLLQLVQCCCGGSWHVAKVSSWIGSVETSILRDDHAGPRCMLQAAQAQFYQLDEHCCICHVVGKGRGKDRLDAWIGREASMARLVYVRLRVSHYTCSG